MFLNDENKRSWGGDETMSEEIYVWTTMTEIKINPDLISALRKYIKFKHQQQWKINEYPIKGKYSWTESFLWTHIYWAVATSQNAKISNHTLPDDVTNQESKRERYKWVEIVQSQENWAPKEVQLLGRYLS